MGFVDALSYEEMDVGGALEQDVGQLGGAIEGVEILGCEIGDGDVFAGELEETAECDDAFGDEVDAVDDACRWDGGVVVLEGGLDALA